MDSLYTKSPSEKHKAAVHEFRNTLPSYDTSIAVAFCNAAITSRRRDGDNPGDLLAFKIALSFKDFGMDFLSLINRF